MHDNSTDIVQSIDQLASQIAALLSMIDNQNETDRTTAPTSTWVQVGLLADTRDQLVELMARRLSYVYTTDEKAAREVVLERARSLAAEVGRCGPKGSGPSADK